MLPLLQGEDVVRRIILVHPHIVGQELDGRRGVGREAVRPEPGVQTFDDGCAAVTAFIVVGYWMLDAVLPLAVGESALAGEAGPERVAHEEPLRDGALPFPVERQAVVGVAVPVLVFIQEEAVTVPVLGREDVSSDRIDAAHPHGVGAAVFEVEAPTHSVGGGDGLQREHTAHGVPPV